MFVSRQSGNFRAQQLLSPARCFCWLLLYKHMKINVLQGCLRCLRYPLPNAPSCFLTSTICLYNIHVLRECTALAVRHPTVTCIVLSQMIGNFSPLTHLHLTQCDKKSIVCRKCEEYGILFSILNGASNCVCIQ